MRVKILLFLFPFLIACNSETQDKAVKEVAATWGTVTEFSKGISTSSSEGSGKYIDIEVTNPYFFTGRYNDAAIPGGIGFILYNNFSDEERKEYKKYEITLKDSLGKEMTYTYEGTLLKRYFDKEAEARQLILELYKRDYKYVGEHFAPFVQINSDTIRNNFGPFIETEGQLINVETYGIKKEERELDGKIEIIEVSGMIIKETDKTPFKVYLDFNKDGANVYYISLE